MSVDFGFGCDNGSGAAQVVTVVYGDDATFKAFICFGVVVTGFQFPFMSSASRWNTHVDVRQLKCIVHLKVLIRIEDMWHLL